MTVRATVDTGVAELRPDPARTGTVTLFVDGVEQSCVDPADPRYLAFGYVRLVAAVLDAAAPVGVPLRVLHLGGGALTVPRYLAAVRPGSVQRVVELDAALSRLVAAHLPVPAGVTVVAGDARRAVDAAAGDGWDVVVADVFHAARSPATVATAGFYAAVAAALRPGGALVANVTDVPPLAYARTQVAAARTAFPGVVVAAEPPVLRARRAGNLVLATGVPVPRLVRGVARHGARVLHGAALDAFAAGARPPHGE
jgi:spermidine synthase